MSAPNLKEVEWAISELEQEESSFPVYAKLANLYTVRSQLLSRAQPQEAAYADIGIPIPEPLAPYGESEFLQAVSGKDPPAAWSVMDELMDTLKAVNRRVYDSVIRKLERI